MNRLALVLGAAAGSAPLLASGAVVYSTSFEGAAFPNFAAVTGEGWDGGTPTAFLTVNFSSHTGSQSVAATSPGRLARPTVINTTTSPLVQVDGWIRTSGAKLAGEPRPGPPGLHGGDDRRSVPEG